MDFLPSFLPVQLAEALGWTLLHSLWQSLAVAVLLHIALSILPARAARVRYGIAYAALLAAFGLALISFAALYTGHPAGNGFPPQSSGLYMQWPVKQGESHLAAATANDNKGTVVQQAYTAIKPAMPWVSALWLAGLIIYAFRLMAEVLYTRRLRRRYLCRPPAEWETLLHKLKTRLQLRTPVALAMSAIVHAPMVIGIIKPMILMPLATLNTMSIAQVEAILAHELAHIRRHDYIFNFIQSLIDALMFFNPATRWISNAVRAEREHCCDDIAIAANCNSIELARALVQLQENAMKHIQSVPALTGGGKQLLRRVQRLNTPNALPGQSQRSAILALVLLLIISVITYETASGIALTSYVSDQQQAEPVFPDSTGEFPSPEVSPHPSYPVQPPSEAPVAPPAIGKPSTNPAPPAPANTTIEALQEYFRNLGISTKMVLFNDDATFTYFEVDKGAMQTAIHFSADKKIQSISNSNGSLPMEEYRRYQHQISNALQQISEAAAARDSVPAHLAAIERMAANRQELLSGKEAVLHRRLAELEAHKQSLRNLAPTYSEEALRERMQQLRMRQTEGQERNRFPLLHRRGLDEARYQAEQKAARHTTDIKLYSHFMDLLRQELQKDKLIQGREAFEVELSPDKLLVNNIEQSDAYHERYRILYESCFNKKLSDTTRWECYDRNVPEEEL